MRRVLLVDNSSDVRSLVRMCLHGSEYLLDEIEDFTSALNRIARQSYDAVLLNVERPGMDGISCAQEIRRLGGKWAVIPLIALTRRAKQETVSEFSYTGFTHHLSKPFDRKSILQVLDESVIEHPLVEFP